MNLDIDIRGVLPSIHVPTLVMNRTNYLVADVEAARDLATHIEGARFVEFPGDTHAFFQGPDPDEVAAEIQEFVTLDGASRSAATGPWRHGPIHGHRRFDPEGRGARRPFMAGPGRASSQDDPGPARTIAGDRDGYGRGRLLRNVRRTGARGPLRPGRGRSRSPAGDRDPCRRAHR